MPGRTRRRLLLSAATLAGAALRGQDVTFRSDVKVVNMLASVVTKKGEIVRSLTKDDFVLIENGRPQQIHYFSQETNLPLTLGLMVDTSGSQEKVLSAERAASFRFLDRVLREDQDQVFIMQYDVGVFLRQKLTSSRKQLEESLGLVDTQTREELRSFGAGTRLYDAIVKASNDILKSRQNRKALILLTDGVDVRSDATLQESIEAAQRADTLIYSILFSDSGAYFGGEGAVGRHALIRMARETGGSFFEVSKKLNLDHVFELIQEELRSQYSLGFVSDSPPRFSEFRKLQLTAKEKGLVVQTRDRYWAQH